MKNLKVRLGTGLKTADDFRSAFNRAGMGIADFDYNIINLPAFTVRREEREVNLVVVSVAELGLEDGAYHWEVTERALDQGLQLCPAEVGPQLSLQYADQPNGERLVIGMAPLTNWGGIPFVFEVRCLGQKRQLSCYRRYPGDSSRASECLVFTPTLEWRPKT